MYPPMALKSNQDDILNISAIISLGAGVYFLIIGYNLPADRQTAFAHSFANQRLLIQTGPRQTHPSQAIRMLPICWPSWFTASKYSTIEWPRVLGVSPMRPTIKIPTD